MGRRVAEQLSKAGDQLFFLSTSLHGDNVIHWDPLKNVAPIELPAVDAVINLAGESLARIPWTGERKRQVRESRVVSTRMLVDALAKSGSRPKVFLSASAIGCYGDTGAFCVDESAAIGRGYLAELGRDWENEAVRAADLLGSRVVRMRIGIVLGPEGGMLKAISPIFHLGLGGRLGSGSQLMSWISIEDLVEAILFLIADESLDGPVNMVAPHPVSNAEFTRVYARSIQRPAFFHVPAFLLRWILGEFAEEMLLKSTGVLPSKLIKGNFPFKFPTIEALFNSPP